MEFLEVETIGLFLLLAGFVVGLGAVTVIDLHGLLARRSAYWTEATIRTHKITKPLIWLGLLLACLGGLLFYQDTPLEGWLLFHVISLPLLILNGLFLSLVVSPYLLKCEKEGRASNLLPQSLQIKVTVSFLISFLGWWGNLAVLVWFITN
jgi:hypothetical protein